MAYQESYLGNGMEAIRCTSGRTCHIVKHDDGTWIVLEDKQLRVFPNRGAALDCAREIAGDPDLPRSARYSSLQDDRFASTSEFSSSESFRQE